MGKQIHERTLGSKWATDKRETYGRIQGRKGMALRKARLSREPLCRHCKAKGKTTLAVTVDHIKPLAQGGQDIDENCQSICLSCHEAKTAKDMGYKERIAIGVDGWPVAQ